MRGISVAEFKEAMMLMIPKGENEENLQNEMTRAFERYGEILNGLEKEIKTVDALIENAENVNDIIYFREMIEKKYLGYSDEFLNDLYKTVIPSDFSNFICRDLNERICDMLKIKKEENTIDNVERNEAMYLDYRDHGMSIAEIADKYDMAKTTVNAIVIKKKKLEQKKMLANASGDDLSILNFYNISDRDLIATSKNTGFPLSKCYRCIVKYYGNIKDDAYIEKRVKMMDEYSEGMSIETLAVKYNMDEIYVKNILKHGIRSGKLLGM